MQCKALFFFLLLPISVAAQNLVPNGSFEDIVSCPEHLDGLEFVDHWYKSIIYPNLDYHQNPSPDYYHVCAMDSIVGVPVNMQGYQMPFDGKAYGGLYTYDLTWSDSREVMGIELSVAMIPGQTYYCSLRYVRPVGWSAVGLASNNLGMKFSNTAFFESTIQAMDGVAHIRAEEVAIDSVNWVLLYGEFVPEHAYEYLHIGNFFSDQETEVIAFNETSRWAYYYIDDVRVSTEPLDVTSVDAQRLGRRVQGFPNPVEEELNIVSSKPMRCIQVYGISGKLIEHIELNKETEFRIDLSHISTGLYIGVVQFESGDTESIKINKI